MSNLSTTNNETGSARVITAEAGAARLAAAKANLAEWAARKTAQAVAPTQELDPASAAAAEGYLPGYKAKPKAKGGYVPLGYDEMDNIVWSNVRNCVVRIKSSEVTQPVMETICGLEWVMANYLEETTDEKKASKLNVGRMRSDLIAGCQAAGRFQDSRVLGAGVWRVKLCGKSELVCNSGDHLFAASSTSVKRISDAGVFAESRSLGMQANLPAATENEVLELSNAIDSWNFRNSSDSLLLLGWLATAPFAGVLDRRPAFNLTGPRGSGKTTLLDAIARLLGGAALKADGASSSAAGLRQALRHDALAVILDEFGDNISTGLKERERIDAIIAQIRTAYSDGTGEGTVKGTSDGKGATYGVRYSALLSGIVPPPLDAADKTRVVVCGLGVLPRGARFPDLFADEDRLADLGARIRMRMFQLWPAVEASLKTVRAAIRTAGNSPRFADTVGTLLAGWYVLMTGEAADAEAASQMLTYINLAEHVQALEGASDERECADWLIGYQVPGAAYSVGELISMVADGKGEHARALETLGLKVNGGRLQVCSATTIKGLRDLFAGSKFQNGGWKTVLERVPGAAEAKPRFAGKTFRAVALPLTWLFDEPATPQQTELGL